MSTPNSLRCLVRPSAASALPRRVAAVSWTAPFSTTPALAAKDNTPAGHVRAGKKMKLGKFKKTSGFSRPKAPAPGERKAFRKRIQLSNSNALPVEGLRELEARDMANPENHGHMLSLPGPLQDQLRTVEAFKTTQYWPMFRVPSMLVRKETVELVNRVQGAADKGQTLRLVITGDRGTGKSMLSLQAMAYAFLNDWVVISIPEGLYSAPSTLASWV